MRKSIINVWKTIFAYLYKIREFFGNHYSYELEGFSFESGGITSIIYKVRGSHRTYKMALGQTYHDSAFLSSFSPLDVKQICKHFTYLQENYIPHGNEIFSPERKLADKNSFLPCLSMLYIVFLVLAILLSPNLINIGSLTEPGGVLLFPITYNIADVICEIYGYSAIRKIIWGSLACLFISTAFVAFSMHFGPAQYNTHYSFYSYIFGNMPRLLIANTASIVISNLANTNLFARLKVITHGKYLWLRIIGGSIIGEMTYTLIWIFIFFYAQLSINQLGQLAIQNYLFKVVYNILLIPITYIVALNLRKLESNAINS